MAVLARASREELETFWQHYFDKPPGCRYIRSPETGMVMVKGRTGGDGKPFNLGEATVTRCTVKLDCGVTGTAYIMGRSKRHAELAAVYDALIQHPDHTRPLLEQLIQPLKKAQAEERLKAAEKTARTKVDFFTMVRGE